eukprot:3321723-Rhodomonas_salina.1
MEGSQEGLGRQLGRHPEYLRSTPEHLHSTSEHAQTAAALPDLGHGPALGVSQRPDVAPFAQRVQQTLALPPAHHHIQLCVRCHTPHPPLMPMQNPLGHPRQYSFPQPPRSSPEPCPQPSRRRRSAQRPDPNSAVSAPSDKPETSSAVVPAACETHARDGVLDRRMMLVPGIGQHRREQIA